MSSVCLVDSCQHFENHLVSRGQLPSAKDPVNILQCTQIPLSIQFGFLVSRICMSWARQGRAPHRGRPPVRATPTSVLTDGTRTTISIHLAWCELLPNTPKASDAVTSVAASVLSRTLTVSRKRDARGGGGRGRGGATHRRSCHQQETIGGGSSFPFLSLIRRG